MVKFRSDESTTLKGFAISFKAVKLRETGKPEHIADIKISSIKNAFGAKSKRILRKGAGVSKRKENKLQYLS